MTEHTGGMIALIPSNPEDFTVDGGESVEEIHLTLLYLGNDVTSWSADQKAIAAGVVASLAEYTPIAEGHVFAHASFNPDGGPDGDKEPCAVYLVGGGLEVAYLRETVGHMIRSDLGNRLIPEQHQPFIPHITAGYGLDVSALSYTGPVIFDKIRIALAGDFVDFDLRNPEDSETEPEEPEGGNEDWTAEYSEKVMSPDPRAAKLRSYWAHGAGRKKWRPGTPGDFRRLRRQLSKYIKNPRILNGLTANIHKLATGQWPGRGRGHGVKVAPGDSAAEEALCQDVEEWGQGFADEDVADYEEDLESEVKSISSEELAAVAELKAVPPGAVDELLLSLDRLELVGETLGTRDEAGEEQESDEEQWSEAVHRDKDYDLTARGQLIPSVSLEQRRTEAGTGSQPTQDDLFSPGAKPAPLSRRLFD